MPSGKTLIVIAGPTAVGKTNVAIDVAEYFQTSIISADSRQFYKGMEIGTAAPDNQQLSKVKHYFVGHLDPVDYFNVSKYETEVIKLISLLHSDNDILVMTGGSGMYIKAVCEGIDNLPDVEPSIRKDLQDLYNKQGLPALRQLLYKLDKVYAEKVDLANPNRLMRALEVTIQTGKPYSMHLTNARAKRDFNTIKIALDLPRKILHERINNRVDMMVANGLIEEVKSLYQLRHLNALNTVGYREIFEYLDSRTTLQEAIEKIKTNTRRYARRQLTWFNKDKEFHWLAPDSKQVIDYINGLFLK